MDTIRFIERSHDLLQTWCRRVHDQGQMIVFTSGVFDLVHHGHVRYLENADSHGDVLVVGVDSDELVRKHKGTSRPIRSEDDRVYLVAGLRPVTIATVFDDIERLITVTVRPNVFVRSESTGMPDEQLDWQERLVRSIGGSIVTLPPQSDISSSEIIRRIRS